MPVAAERHRQQRAHVHALEQLPLRRRFPRQLMEIMEDDVLVPVELADPPAIRRGVQPLETVTRWAPAGNVPLVRIVQPRAFLVEHEDVGVLHVHGLAEDTQRGDESAVDAVGGSKHGRNAGNRRFQADPLAHLLGDAVELADHVVEVAGERGDFQRSRHFKPRFHVAGRHRPHGALERR